MSNQWTLLLTIYGQNMGRAIKRPTLLNSICISIESIDVLSFASYQHSLMQWYTKTGHKNVVAISTQMVKRLPQDLTKSRKKSLCLNRAVNSVGWQSIYSCIYKHTARFGGVFIIINNITFIKFPVAWIYRKRCSWEVAGLLFDYCQLHLLAFKSYTIQQDIVYTLWLQFGSIFSLLNLRDSLLR